MQIRRCLILDSTVLGLTKVSKHDLKQLLAALHLLLESWLDRPFQQVQVIREIKAMLELKDLPKEKPTLIIFAEMGYKFYRLC
jgi:hypothetical protein